MTASATSLRRAIIICALGYFIDVFDIQLFAVLRIASLKDLGVPDDRLAAIGGYILNAQMFGMILGGFFWGWLGDRFGRLKALYGSILVYSIGTLACSGIGDPAGYGFLRFLTGFGLAGETGAAITLIAEMMSPKKRGWGITLVAGFGLLGPVFAIVISWFFTWRETYVIAGLLGLGMLVLRLRLREPALFLKAKIEKTMQGSWKLITQPRRLKIFIYCLMTGLPMSYAWFVLNFFSAELSQSVLKPGESFNQKLCLFLFYLATSFGDALSGIISQIWQSRRKTFAVFLFAGIVVIVWLLIVGPEIKMTAGVFYVTYFMLGLMGGGCLILFFTMAAEHFGTNVRATTAIALPNLSRGSSILMIFAFQELQHFVNITNSAVLIGIILYVSSLLALRQLRETHGLDLDYVETR